MHAEKPLARSDELVVESLEGETLVYDLRDDQAHCLDADAGGVWAACDGEQTIAAIAVVCGLPRDAVVATLETLQASGLLDERPGVSRRRLLRSVAIGAGIGVAYPVIRSISAPSSAQAVSCLNTGTGCTTSAQCCSNLCSGSVCT